MAKTRPANPVSVALWIALHLAFASLTWQDVKRRPEHGIRGSKAVWRVASSINSLGSVLYWIFGRRPLN